MSLSPSKKLISDKYRPAYADDLPSLLAALPHGISGTSDTVAEFEAALATYFGSAHAIAVSSGAAALSVALGALGIRAGDEVALTPTCPLCTVYPVMAAGATPVFVDTHADDFGINLSDLDRVVNPGLRAIIDIPMWGYPSRLDALQAMARERELPLILDLAHSHGSTLHGRPLSAYGDLACFSTHERKPLATGEGGFMLTDDDDIARRCRDYSRFGNLNGRDFGLNYKLGALAAALGRSRLRHLPAQLAARRNHAMYLLSRLKHPAVREFSVAEGGAPNYYVLALRLSFRDNRRFIDHLDAHGIPSDIKRYGCCCLYEFPALARYRRECPNGAALLASMTTLPVHPDLGTGDMDHIADVINRYQE